MRVESLEHLKELASSANGDYVDFYIVLAGGLARSSKMIQYDPEYDNFCVINEIDDSFQSLTPDQLSVKTNLIEAIQKSALFKE